LRKRKAGMAGMVTGRTWRATRKRVLLVVVTATVL
jgi:hypothetical protein